MSSKTEIAWTDATWNPVTGCTRVSEGCRNCYIERTPAFRIQGRKFAHGTTGVQLHPDRLDQPLKWKAPRRIFVNSLSDLFHEDVPDEFIDQVMRAMANTKRHTYQVLTKRPARMLTYLSGWWKRCYQDFESGAYIPVNPCPHIWFGVSVENQETADERIPLLLQTPAAKRFISAEPLLGPVKINFERCYRTQHVDRLSHGFLFDGDDPYVVCVWCGERRDAITNRLIGSSFSSRLDWVIVGGESGPGARPCDVAWIRSIVQQCQAAKVPVFVKQLGSSVVDRNDAGFEGDTDESWPMDTKFEQEWSERNYQGTLGRVRLKKKGGDWNEWPADLRVREYPTKGARHE